MKRRSEPIDRRSSVNRPRRVLLADDSAVIRRVVREALERDPSIECCDTVQDGDQLLQRAQAGDYDVILLDVEMPGRDGIDTLRVLRDQGSTIPVIMFSTLTERGAKATIEALLLGAADYVTKPQADNLHSARDEIAHSLLPRIQALATRRAKKSDSRSEQRRPELPLPPIGPVASSLEAVAIAASTGGPQALAELLGQLEERPDAVVFIVQHLPNVFTGALASHLSKLTGLEIREAWHGAACQPGDIWLARGDQHLRVERQGDSLCLALDHGARINACRPSADALFQSVAQHYAERAVGVVLTGMGRDGCDGSSAIAAAGGWILAQDHASSVVWGMPRAVVEGGIAHYTGTPAELALLLADWAGIGPLQTQT